MTRWALVAPLLLLSASLHRGAVGQASEEPTAAPGRASDGAPAEDDADDWGLNSLRGGLESVGGYFDSVLELMGGRDGVCQHRCRYGRNLSSLSSSMSKMVSGFLENERFLFMTSEEDTVDSFSYLLPCWRWPNTEFTVHFQGPCPTPASPRNQTWPLGLKSGCSLESRWC